MKLHRSFLPVALVALGASTSAQDVGSQMPPQVALENFAQIQAKSYDELFGRAVLIEFFAYW